MAVTRSDRGIVVYLTDSIRTAERENPLPERSRSGCDGESGATFARRLLQGRSYRCKLTDITSPHLGLPAIGSGLEWVGVKLLQRSSRARFERSNDRSQSTPR